MKIHNLPTKHSYSLRCGSSRLALSVTGILWFYILVLTPLIGSTSCTDKKGAEESFTDKSEGQPYRSNEENNTEISSDVNYPDNTYCAEVEYFNPNTGTHSSYTLTIEVESNEITQINFPNGGWMDNDHFSNIELEDDGTANFTSDKGYDYEIKIIGSGGNCFTDDVPRAVQCNGETKTGDQCKNMTDNENGLCWRHQDQE